MPAKFSSRCKTCKSRLRSEIERMHDQGMSDFAISKRVKEMGESISDKSLKAHFTKHYDLQAEVKELYYEELAKSQENLEANAKERLSDLQILDEMVQEKFEIHKQLGSTLKLRARKSDNPSDDSKIPIAYVSLYNGCSSEICKILKTKAEILGEDPLSKQAQSIEKLSDNELENLLGEIVTSQETSSENST